MESPESDLEPAISQEWARVYREAKLRKRAVGASRSRTNRMLRQARIRRIGIFIGALTATIVLFVLCLVLLK